MPGLRDLLIIQFNHLNLSLRSQRNLRNARRVAAGREILLAARSTVTSTSTQAFLGVRLDRCAFLRSDYPT